MQEKHIIIGVHVTERLQRVRQVQDIMSEYGCNIKTRLGLHEVGENFCSPNGLLVLEMVGSDETIDKFVEKMTAIEGIEIKKMVFEHS